MSRCLARDNSLRHPHKNRCAIVLTCCRAVGQAVACVTTWPTTGISFGGDYNPEQWPEHVRAEDVALMREAGVNFVSRRDLLLGAARAAAGRVRLRLAGPGAWTCCTTAASGSTWPPPPRRRRLAGPAAPRGAAGRPGRQPAVARQPAGLLPHLAGLRRAVAAAGRAAGAAGTPTTRRWRCGTSSNELGCHNAHCYCDVSAAAFRGWLQRAVRRPRTALNEAWGTAFWSQHYADWLDVLPPRNHHGARQPDPGAGLLAVLLRRAAGHLPRRARRAARG